MAGQLVQLPGTRPLAPQPLGRCDWCQSADGERRVEVVPAKRAAVGRALAPHHISVAKLLAGYRFSYAAEHDLREAVATVLDAELPFTAVERDVKLFGPVRAELLVDERICVAVRVAGRAAQVLLELEALALEHQVDGLVLVTNRASRSHVPATLGGKPLAILGVAKGDLQA